MTRRRWIADEVSGDRAVLLGSHAHHLAVVLRARIGQQFDVAAGDVLRSGRITFVSPDRIEFELGEKLAASKSSHITLLMAVFKFDRMEWAIEKCTELGVARIVPAHCPPDRGTSGECCRHTRGALAKDCPPGIGTGPPGCSSGNGITDKAERSIGGTG